jgi:hypothetical protein
MQKIAAFVSKTNQDWLIPINELKTLDTGICDILNFQRMTQDDEFAGDILYGWSEGIADNRKHCVAPLVHVLVSERLSHAVMSNYGEDKQLPAVFIMPSTPRSMDWVIVLHLFAYKRPQEFAFTESRGLLKVNQESPVYRHWAAERVSHEWLGDTAAPNFCYGLFPTMPRPAPLGVDKDLTVEVAHGGMICREYWADWVFNYHHGKTAAITVDSVVSQVQEVEERIRKIGGTERLLKVMPSDSDEFRLDILRATGRDLLEAMRRAKLSDLIVFFSQAGELRYVADPEGHLIDTDSGAGAEIAAAVLAAGSRTTGDGIDTVSDKLMVVRPADTAHYKEQVQRVLGSPKYLSVFTTAKQYGLTLEFSQSGKLVSLRDGAGNLADMRGGWGLHLVELCTQAAASKRVVEVVPVGTKLKAEFYDLAQFIGKNRPLKGMADIPTQTRLGNKEAYHYPPYCSPIQGILEKSQTLQYAQEAGLVIVTLNDDFQQLVTICDSSGHEICISRGMGNDIARAFGGVVGRTAQK